MVVDVNRAGHLEEHKFQLGKSGNPEGRPAGCRNGSTRMAETLKKIIFKHALRKVEMTLHGKPLTERRLQLALTRLHREDPKAYADIVLKAMPKNVDIDLTAEVNHKLTWASMIEESDRAAQRARDLEASAN